MKKNDYQNLMEHIQAPRRAESDRCSRAPAGRRETQNETDRTQHLRPESGARCSGRQYAPPVHWRWW